MLFKDRRDAGKKLVPKLSQYKGRTDVVVLGLARGGVVTASEVAAGLQVALDVIFVRKIGAPGNAELAIGAIAEHGEGVFNESLIGMLGVSSDYLKKETEHQKQILKERLVLYRGKSTPVNLAGKTVILVDDGIATGASMRVAIKSVREAGVKKVVLAVPVAAPDSLNKMSQEADEVECLYTPVFFESVGGFYRDFAQTSDEEVMHILESY